MNDQSQPTQKASKTGMWVALIVVISIVVGGVYYFLSGDDSTSNINLDVNAAANLDSNINSMAIENTNVDTNTNAASNVNATIDTSDWQTYTNTQYGFSLEYPSSWIVSQRNATSGFFRNDNSIAQYIIEDPNTPYGSVTYFDSCNMSVFPNDDGKTAQSWLDDSDIYVTAGEGVHMSTSESVTIDDFDAIAVHETGPNATKATSYYFIVNDNILRYGYYIGLDIEDRNIFLEYSRICSEIARTLRVL